MKKLILAMVFVFATGTTFMNANIKIENKTTTVLDCFDFANDITDSPWCFEYANGFASAWAEDNPGANYEDEYNTFVSEYDDCESKTNNPQFQFPML